MLQRTNVWITADGNNWDASVSQHAHCSQADSWGATEHNGLFTEQLRSHVCSWNCLLYGWMVGEGDEGTRSYVSRAVTWGGRGIGCAEKTAPAQKHCTLKSMVNDAPDCPFTCIPLLFAALSQPNATHKTQLTQPKHHWRIDRRETWGPIGIFDSTFANPFLPFVTEHSIPLTSV